MGADCAFGIDTKLRKVFKYHILDIYQYILLYPKKRLGIIRYQKPVRIKNE